VPSGLYIATAGLGLRVGGGGVWAARGSMLAGLFLAVVLGLGVGKVLHLGVLRVLEVWGGLLGAVGVGCGVGCGAGR